MSRRERAARQRAFVLASLLGVSMVAASQSPRGIAVVYPDVEEPYRRVFTKMLEGIEAQAKGPVTSVAIGNSQNPQDVANELRRQDVRVVIALGRNGVKVASNLERNVVVLIGGVVSVPEAGTRNFVVSSLAPDPALLFSRLQGFTQALRRVFVVYDPAQNDWLVRLARQAAAARGIELMAFEAADLKAAMVHYQTIVATMAPGRDALWLPMDTTTVQEATVLPLVLQEAWNRNLTVFSSNVAHVRRGALFALYPDNLEVGRSLADSALGYLSTGNPATPGTAPLKAALLAVNVRTAAHLGIDIARHQAAFDLVFPER